MKISNYLKILSTNKEYNMSEDYKRRADSEALKLFNDKELKTIHEIAIDCKKNRDSKYKGQHYGRGDELYKAVLEDYKNMRKREYSIPEDIRKLKDMEDEYSKKRLKNLEDDLEKIKDELSKIN